MAFEKAAAPPPVRIESVSINLQKLIARNADGTDGAVKYAARFVVRTEDAAGDPSRVVEGELLQHLTPAQVNGLRTFIDDMHNKARAEVL